MEERVHIFEGNFEERLKEFQIGINNRLWDAEQAMRQLPLQMNEAEIKMQTFEKTLGELNNRNIENIV